LDEGGITENNIDNDLNKYFRKWWKMFIFNFLFVVYLTMKTLSFDMIIENNWRIIYGIPVNLQGHDP
jgi:hypothetical protein